MKKTNRLWDYYSKAYDSLLCLNSYRDLIDKMIKNSDFKDGENILDIGSGTGNIELYSNKRSRFLCLDNSDEMIRRAKEKKLINVFDIHKVDLNLFPYPVGSKKFDKVISSNSLYTIHDLDKCLKEVNRILKPKGIFIFTNSITDGFYPLVKEEVRSLNFKRLIKLLAELHKILFILLVNLYIDHIFKATFYSEEVLLNNLEKNGFRVIKKEYIYANLNILVVAEKVK